MGCTVLCCAVAVGVTWSGYHHLFANRFSLVAGGQLVDEMVCGGRLGNLTSSF